MTETGGESDTCSLKNLNFGVINSYVSPSIGVIGFPVRFGTTNYYWIKLAVTSIMRYVDDLSAAFAASINLSFMYIVSPDFIRKVIGSKKLIGRSSCDRSLPMRLPMYYIAAIGSNFIWFHGGSWTRTWSRPSTSGSVNPSTSCQFLNCSASDPLCDGGFAKSTTLLRRACGVWRYGLGKELGPIAVGVILADIRGFRARDALTIVW